MLTRLLHDWVRVKLDPVGENECGGILLVEPHMVRTGVVEEVGPGKRYVDGPYVPTEVRVGERVAFFAGNMDTKQGKTLRAFIQKDEVLIPETSILFVLELEEGEPLPRIDTP